MGETLFEEMKRYVRFSADDAGRLARLGALATPHLVEIAREFYDRIREHEAAHAVFKDEAQVERLQKMLVVWMQQLFDGPHDEAYFQARARVGRTHVKIGLPQRYMFTAMALIRSALARHAVGLPAAERAEALDSLGRALDLELAIMLETYRDAFSERLARIEREEREQRLATLVASERRYVHAVEIARLIVVGVDRDGLVRLFNHEAERVTGLKREDVFGQSALLLLPERERESLGTRLLQLARGETDLPPDTETPLLTNAGHERRVEWSLSRVGDGGDAWLVAIGRDVTDERARATQLRRTEKLAAVGTLAAGLAHEIRNPLNGALLHVTFLDRALRKSGGSEEALSAVRFVNDEIRRLSGLVKDFLVFARPSPPDLKPVSVHDLCRRAVDVVRSDADAVHTEVSVDLGTQDVVLPLDGQKVEQVLLNLLRNAIDAVATIGGGHVVLRERRRPSEVLLQVEDDGPGLPSPEAPIFDAFYTTKATGTGLGLSIVHRIVGDHGGSVSVDSSPGRTVFSVLLPLRHEGGTS